MSPEEKAAEIGLPVGGLHECRCGPGWDGLCEAHRAIAEAIRDAVREENEACARVADARADKAYARFEVLGHDHLGRDMAECLEGRAVASEIRARVSAAPACSTTPDR